MNRALIFATRAGAERAIDALTEAHAPGGVETVRVISRGRVVSEEQRPAKPWAEPVELEDGRFAVTVSPRKLATIAGCEVAVRGERLRVPRAQDVSEIEIAPRSDRPEETMAQRVWDMTPVNTYQPPPPEEPEPEDP